jgi:hypothetical protein
MKNNEYIMSIEGVTDRKKFFAELLAFYAPQDGVLTIWGKLPKYIQERLAQIKAPCSWIRCWLFQQSEWHLNSHSLNLLSQELCDDELLENLTWGLIKSDIPLGLCRNWDDMNLDGSKLIEEAELCTWLDQLKSKGLLQSYENGAFLRQCLNSEINYTTSRDLIEVKDY